MMIAGSLALLTASLIIFMIFVLPVWLFLHYRSKRQSNDGITEQEYRQMQQLAADSEKMLERIASLEAILDSDSPDWKTRL